MFDRLPNQVDNEILIWWIIVGNIPSTYVDNMTWVRMAYLVQSCWPETPFHPEPPADEWTRLRRKNTHILITMLIPVRNTVINEVRRTVVLTMHQKRRGGDFIATVLISECGRLFDGGEMFGGGRRVNMAHLDSRRRWSLDIALSWKRERYFVGYNMITT